VSIPAAIPAAVVALGAAAGTITGDVPRGVAVALLLGAWAVAAAGFALGRRRAAAFGTAAVFASAAWLLSARATREAADPPLRAALAGALADGPVVLEGRLRDDAAPGETGVALVLDVDRWRDGREWRAASGGVRLTVGGTLGLGRFDAWRAGRLIRVAALLHVPGRYQDPGVPDGRLALGRRGIALVGSVKSGALVEVRARGGWTAEGCAAARALARAAIRRHVGRFDAQSAAIVVAILIGDRVGLDDEVQRRLQEAGTYHVIAISGGNIAILAGLMLWLLRVAGAGHRLSNWATAAVLVGYAALVGGGASVVRATVMAVLYLAARQAGHRSVPANALAVTCAVILLATPEAIADVAFWLTFGATLGILAGVWMAGRRLPRAPWLRAPAALLLTSLCAELALLPVAALAFSRVTFAGLGLNFVAIPMMSLAQVAGMVTVPASWLWPRAADWCGFLAHLGASGLVRSAALVDLAPWLSWRLPPPHWIAVAGYYAGWAACLWAFAVGAPAGAAGRLRAPARRTGLAVVIASGLWVLVEPVSLVAPGVAGRLRLTVIDVAHGDALLVQLPDRRSLLVDTGGSLSASRFDIGGRVVAPVLWARGARRLDALVLTHGDPDHVGGAVSVFRDFRPRAVWEGVPVPTVAATEQLRAMAAAARVPWSYRRAGESWRMGDVAVRVFHPPPPDWERRKVRNDDSIVMELRYGGVSIVLTGDAGTEVERTIAGEFAPSALRVIKVPHHGSATSSSWEFVSALRPRVALLSAGATTRVSDEVLRRYRDAGAAIFRTDRDGAITLDTDGRRVTVTTFSGQRITVGDDGSQAAGSGSAPPAR
jgi:competence protein ComEC